MTEPNKYHSLQPLEKIPEFCTVEGCGVEIKTMAWKGTGVCGDIHRKAKGIRIEGEK